VTKTHSARPISCLEHRTTRMLLTLNALLHCAIVTRAAVLMFPLLLQTIISNQMRLRRLRAAWFSRLLRHLECSLSPRTPRSYSPSCDVLYVLFLSKDAAVVCERWSMIFNNINVIIQRCSDCTSPHLTAVADLLSVVVNCCCSLCRLFLLVSLHYE